MTITQSSTRFVAVAAGLLLALSLVFAPAFSPAQAAGLSQTQIQSILSLLSSFGADQATINNVNAALNGQATGGSTGGSTTGACPALSRSLQVGSTGSDVKALQIFLNSSATTQVASAGAGSPGNESTYFGAATKAAVIKFQAANGVSAIGIVGPATRAAIAAVCGKGGSTGGNTGGNTGGTVGGTVTVSAAAQPVNSLAPKGASRVPFTTFTITNNSSSAVTINSVTVQRGGLAQDAAFSGVVLLDQNGIQIGNAKTFNSNHQANVGDVGFTINAGSSMTFTVAGNMASDQSSYSGQVASLQVVAINTSATVSGSLPITGASQTINNTLTVGTYSTTTSAVVPQSGSHTNNIGDTGVRFSGVKLTAGSAEDLKLYSVRWRQIGSASSVDLGNVTTVANGTSYPTTIDSTGKYYTTVFPGGILVAKGNSVDLYVQGDLSGSNSAGRTVQFTIDRSTDVYFVGQLYGYGIADTSSYVNTQPWYTGDLFTIQAGTASTISKSNVAADAAQNIAVNVPNQPLGGFTTNFLGEPVQVSTLKITIATSSGFTGNGPITGISIVNDNGAVVAGPVDGATTCTSGCTITFTDTVTFPVGKSTYHVRGKIPSGVSNNSTLTVTVDPTTWTGVTGQVSGNTVSLASNSSFALNQMTVRSAVTTITVSSNPASQNIVAGTQGFTFANIQLDASQSGEDVRYSSLPLSFAGTAANLNSCQIFDGSTALVTGSRIINSLSTSAANTFSFDSALVVPKGTVKTLSVVCNLSSSASGGTTAKFGIDSSYTYSASGVTSGTSVTPTVTTATGGTMTVASGSLAVSVDSSSPSYKIASGGQTGVTMGVIKLRASNEALNLTKLGLTLTATSGSGNKSSDLTQVYLYNGSTLVGTASFTGTNTSATSTLSTPVALTKDADTLITVKADIADIGTSQPGTEGDLIKIDPLNAEATGASSGTTIQTGATAGVAGVRIFNSFPTIAQDTVSTNAAAGRLMRFKVTADSAGTIGIAKFAFNISTTTLTLSNIGLYAYTDSSYSSPVSDSIGAGSGQVDTTLATTTCSSAYNTSAGSSCTISGSITTLKFLTATNALQVPAGTTRYFELRGSVAGAASGASAVTTLLADTAMATGTAATLVGSYNFVWSPNATSTQAITGDNDWTTGYTVPGLPASGLIQTVSQ